MIASLSSEAFSIETVRDLLATHLAVVVRGAVSRERCRQWVRGVQRGREDWTSDFGGEQFALGRAFYTHLETGRAEEYFREASRADARVEAHAPGLQACMREMVERIVGGRAVPRAGWCGPGVHVFPAGEKVARVGGVVHFDLEGLPAHHVARHQPAITAVLMLQPPRRGGGLRVWDVTHASSNGVEDEALSTTSVLAESDVGDLVVIDSYRLHQIQPFTGTVDRISATVHAAEIDRGRWETWF